MNPKKTKVSIIMAAFNEEELIGRSIDSLLAQSYSNFELLVVDDGSTDRTEQIVREKTKKSKKIKLYKIKHIKGKGCVRPRVNGIKKSEGEIIFLVDADAWYEKDYLKKCIPALKGKTAGVIGKLRVWEPKTFISKYRDLQYRLRYDNPERIKREMKEGRIAAWIFTKKAYKEAGEYNESLPYGEDIDLARRMMKKGYTLEYVPNAVWKHKWPEFPCEVMKFNYATGKKSYLYFKTHPKQIIVKGYFGLIIPLLALVPFHWAFLALALLHALPMEFKGINLMLKSKSGHRAYALLAPLVFYTMNIPFFAGLVAGFLEKEATE